MPKLTPYNKISENKFEFEQKVAIVGYDARIHTPKRLADQIKGKRLKVTIEVIDDRK